MLKKFLSSLVNIIYPKSCLICNRPLKDAAADEILCVNCYDDIKINRPTFCNRCGRHIMPKHTAAMICPECRRRNLALDRAFSACRYEGVTKELIHKFKYEDKYYLDSVLSKILIKFVKEYNIPIELFDLVVPIPLHKSRLREREFNQAKLLAQHLSSRFSLELSCNNLYRKRNNRRQTELTNKERWANIKDTFSIKYPNQFKDKYVLLVDDVMTTGATCSEAADLIKQAGAKIVFVLTLAG